MWAGRSVRYDRRVRNAEVGGSNPPRSTKNNSAILDAINDWLP